MPTIETEQFRDSVGGYNAYASWIRLYDWLTPQYFVQYGHGCWYSSFACVVDDFGDLIPVRKDGRPFK